MNRLYFVDSLKLLAAISVIVFHVGCGFSKMAPWWYQSDPANILGINILLAVVDLYVMGLFFFLSGYFADKALNRSPFWGFFRSKARLLLVPGYINLMIFGPLMVYVYHVSREPSSISLLDSYLAVIKQWTSVGFEVIQPGSEAYHHHIWFVEVLFAIFILTKISFAVGSKIRGMNSLVSLLQERMLLALVLLFVLSSVLVMPLNATFKYDAWTKFANFIVFQPTRVLFYWCAFLLGLLAFRGKWFIRYSLGQLSLRFFLSLVITFAMGSMVFLALKNVLDETWIKAYSFAFNKTILGFACIFVSVILFKGLIAGNNRLSYWGESYSYGLYLIHMPIAIGLQYAFSFTSWSTVTKFSIAAGLAVLLSFLAIIIYRRIWQWINNMFDKPALNSQAANI